jgi:hypothetical protein
MTTWSVRILECFGAANVSDAFGSRSISFGDTVRVVSNDLTESLGLAGAVGSVYGQTVPSSSGVSEIIGPLTEDYAVNVFLEDRGEQFWFAEQLLEFVDHGTGGEITLHGIDKKWMRSASGEWTETPLSTQPGPSWLKRIKSLFKRGNN